MESSFINKGNDTVVEKRVEHSFVIPKVQPALLGLMDGSGSIVALLFATAGLIGQALKAFMWW